MFELIHKMKPLVHHITNWVTIYDCANITRAFGGLPVMAHAREESGDMAGLASALVLNIGTLTPELVDSRLLRPIRSSMDKISLLQGRVAAWLEWLVGSICEPTTLRSNQGQTSGRNTPLESAPRGPAPPQPSSRAPTR